MSEKAEYTLEAMRARRDQLRQIQEAGPLMLELLEEYAEPGKLATEPLRDQFRRKAQRVINFARTGNPNSEASA